MRRNPCLARSRLSHPLALCLLLLLLSLQSFVTSSHVYATTFTVCDTDCNFDDIEAAIDSLRFGNTILVSPGTYRLDDDLLINSDNSGTESQRAILTTTGGPVILDCSDPFDDTNLWTHDANGVYFAARALAEVDTPSTQVFVNDVRCEHHPEKDFDALGENEWRYDFDNNDIYLKVPGGGNPGSQEVYITSKGPRRGIDVSAADYVTIRGFTVLRASREGIRVKGASTSVRATGVVIDSCISAYNWEQGIRIEFGDNVTVSADTVYNNGSHGIYILKSSNCVVEYNTAYNNDDPEDDFGSVNGIRVGTTTSGPQDDTMFNDVDYNRTYDNEDSGIEVRGSRYTRIRRNVSWSNLDHGYDFNGARAVSLIGNVSTLNDHDGVSVESSADSMSIYNCIIAGNAQDASTLQGGQNTVSQLFVDNRFGLKSDHNVIFGETTHPGDGFRRYLIWSVASSDTFNLIEDWTAVSMTDSASIQVAPLFSDSLNGDFRLSSVNSGAIDQGASASYLTDWLGSADGFVPHDVADGHAPDGPRGYVDIGAYEWDVPPAKTTSLGYDVIHATDVELKWNAPGDDGDVGTGGEYMVKFSTSAITDANWDSATESYGEAEPQPDTSGTLQYHTAGVLQPSTTYYFALKTKDEDNGQWSVVSDNVSATTIACCTSGYAMRPASSGSVGAAGRGPNETAATPVTDAVVLEMNKDGDDRSWVAYAAPASSWVGESRPAPFILFEEPDGAGGWRARSVYDYGVASFGIAPPSHDGTRVVMVGPRGPERFFESVRTPDGGGLTMQSADHSRLGDIVNELAGDGETIDLPVGDTLAVFYEASPSSVEGASSAFFVVGNVGGADPTSAKRLGEIPRVFALAQNRPNPFSTTTMLRFDLPRAVDVRLDVFDVLGRRVARLANGSFEPGYHSVTWDRRGRSGQRVPAGVYLYRLQAGSFRAEKKMVLMP